MRQSMLIVSLCFCCLIGYAQMGIQNSVVPNHSQSPYQYSYGGSLGYYIVNGYGLNFHVKYNFSEEVSFGGVVFFAIPDPEYNNYLSQKKYYKDHVVTDDVMASIGALIKGQIHLYTYQQYNIYASASGGLAFSSLSLWYQEYVYNLFPPYGGLTTPREFLESKTHFIYSIDLGVSVEMADNMDLFGELGFGMDLFRIGFSLHR